MNHTFLYSYIPIYLFTNLRKSAKSVVLKKAKRTQFRTLLCATLFL
jgi:hypothetical protein